MAGIPQNFQSISPVIANYDFVDIASGTGYINFYAGKTVDKYLLSNFDFYSENILTSGTTTGVNETVIVDIDFDVVLNRPLDVRGLGILNIPGYTNDGFYVKVILRKWNGVVETDICTNNSTEVNPNAAKYYYFSVDLDVPLTHFKIGETLRLTIQGIEKASAAGKVISIGHDPANRQTDGTLSWGGTATYPTKLTFQCPVRLNL